MSKTSFQMPEGPLWIKCVGVWQCFWLAPMLIVSPLVPGRALDTHSIAMTYPPTGKQIVECSAGFWCSLREMLTPWFKKILKSGLILLCSCMCAQLYMAEIELDSEVTIVWLISLYLALLTWKRKLFRNPWLANSYATNNLVLKNQRVNVSSISLWEALCFCK